MKVADITIEDIGVEHSQYFPGRGLAYTEYDDVVTGVGSDFEEAVNDAMQQLYHGSGWDTYTIPEDVTRALDADRDRMTKSLKFAGTFSVEDAVSPAYEVSVTYWHGENERKEFNDPDEARDFYRDIVEYMRETCYVTENEYDNALEFANLRTFKDPSPYEEATLYEAEATDPDDAVSLSYRAGVVKLRRIPINDELYYHVALWVTHEKFEVGQRVYWTDPGDDLGSGPGTIVNADNPEVIALKMDSGSEAEVMPHEIRLLDAEDGTEGQDRESYTDEQDRDNYTV